MANQPLTFGPGPVSQPADTSTLGFNPGGPISSVGVSLPGSIFPTAGPSTTSPDDPGSIFSTPTPSTGLPTSDTSLPTSAPGTLPPSTPSASATSPSLLPPTSSPPGTTTGLSTPSLSTSTITSASSLTGATSLDTSSTDSFTSTSTTSSAPSTSSSGVVFPVGSGSVSMSHVSTGAIVGAVIGGLAVLLAVLGLYLFIRISRRNRSRNPSPSPRLTQPSFFAAPFAGAAPDPNLTPIPKSSRRTARGGWAGLSSKEGTARGDVPDPDIIADLEDARTIEGADEIDDKLGAFGVSPSSDGHGASPLRRGSAGSSITMVYPSKAYGTAGSGVGAIEMSAVPPSPDRERSSSSLPRGSTGTARRAPPPPPTPENDSSVRRESSTRRTQRKPVPQYDERQFSNASGTSAGSTGFADEPLRGSPVSFGPVGTGSRERQMHYLIPDMPPPAH